MNRFATTALVALLSQGCSGDAESPSHGGELRVLIVHPESGWVPHAGVIEARVRPFRREIDCLDDTDRSRACAIGRYRFDGVAPTVTASIVNAEGEFLHSGVVEAESCWNGYDPPSPRCVWIHLQLPE